MSSSYEQYVFRIHASSDLKKIEVKLDNKETNKDKIIVYPSEKSFTPKEFKETYNIKLCNSNDLRPDYHKVLYDLKQRTAILYRRDGNPVVHYIGFDEANSFLV